MTASKYTTGTARLPGDRVFVNVHAPAGTSPEQLRRKARSLLRDGRRLTRVQIKERAGRVSLTGVGA